MNHPPATPQRPARPLLTGKEIRAAAAAGAPGYGQAFTDEDWERLAERLEALARLLWEFSQRQADEEAQRSEAHR